MILTNRFILVNQKQIMNQSVWLINLIHILNRKLLLSTCSTLKNCVRFKNMLKCKSNMNQTSNSKGEYCLTPLVPYPPQTCKKDEECCAGQLCVWGQCASNSTKGDAGTICQYQSDCKEEFCCAFHKGIYEHLAL